MLKAYQECMISILDGVLPTNLYGSGIRLTFINLILLLYHDEKDEGREKSHPEPVEK